MNEPVALPALDGRDPLGFLAALGTARLLDEAGVDIRLSWDRRSASALLHGVASLDDVIDVMSASVVSGGWMPRLPMDWLPKMAVSGGDKARIQRDAFGDRVAEVGDWATALWTDLAVEERKGTDPKSPVLTCSCTPFYAPMGKQSMNQMFSACHALVAAEPASRLREAFVGWRRVPGHTGESLDIRALESSAEAASGESSPAGVPGATWLALAALPLFRMTGDTRGPIVVGWHYVKRSRRLVWPLWAPPLDIDAIAVLLDHPSLVPLGTDRRTIPHPLGVFEVREATRRPTPAGKSAGVLAAVEHR